jgi:amidase
VPSHGAIVFSRCFAKVHLGIQLPSLPEMQGYKLSDDLWRLDATELSDLIRSREVSCSEVIASCLARLERVNPEINAVVQVCADEAVQQGIEADKQLASGQAIGPLHGVPVTIKINNDQKGWATSNGVAAFAETVAKEDSPSVANLRKAGAIIVGRTNSPEFAWRWFTDNDLYGETINPRNPAITCGGSSGGAAAAVAAGIGPIGQGSDFGGSIRHPALCCGVAGLRPTPGRVPAYNPSAEDRPATAQLMAVQGPIARSIRDLRLSLTAMSARDVRDPWWVPAPLAGNPIEKPVKVALIDSEARPGLHPGIAAALSQAASWLEDAGYLVERVASRSSPSVDEASRMWSMLVLNELKMVMVPQIRKLGGSAIRKTAELMVAQAPDADFHGYMKALARRAALLREWQIFFERYPIVLMPVCREPAFELGLDQLDDAAMTRIFEACSPLLAPATLGLPCVSVPTSIAQDIPLGVQIVSGRFREDLCLDAAEAIESRATVPTPIDPVKLAR